MKCVRLTLIVIFINLSTFKGLFAPNLSDYVTEQKQLNMERITRLNELMRAEFSKENLKALIIILELPDPEMIYNQARLETGNFTSRVFKEGANLFGMHKPRIRPTTSKEYIIADYGRRVAKYETWQDSVLDMVHYYEYYESLGYSTDNYLVFLQEVGYCEGDQYTNILKNMS